MQFYQNIISSSSDYIGIRTIKLAVINIYLKYCWIFYNVWLPIKRIFIHMRPQKWNPIWFIIISNIITKVYLKTLTINGIYKPFVQHIFLNKYIWRTYLYACQNCMEKYCLLDIHPQIHILKKRRALRIWINSTNIYLVSL